MRMVYGRCSPPAVEESLRPAQANTNSAWELSCSLAKKVVLLHLPERNNDPYGLWTAVESATAGADNLFIPQIGECVAITK